MGMDRRRSRRCSSDRPHQTSWLDRYSLKYPSTSHGHGLETTDGILIALHERWQLP